MTFNSSATVVLVAIIALLTGLTVEVQAFSSSQSLINGTPSAFTENKGQWDDQVLFRADAGAAALWFTSEGVVHHFVRRIRTAEGSAFGPLVDMRQHDSDSVESMAIRANFMGANPGANVIGLEKMEYKCNYFIGNDPAKWRTDVPNYREIVYEDIYFGIDLKYYSNGRQMEYDFIVSPGADLSQIEIQYEGPESVTVNEAGELVLTTMWGEVVEQRPVVYQEIFGERYPVIGEYVMRGPERFGFDVSAGYDPSLALIIDPVIEYSTYLGGSGYDYGNGIALDTSGCAYIVGETPSSDFPTHAPFLATNQGHVNVFVTKLSGEGNSLVYSTFLGGSESDRGYDIAVDSSGCAYLTGYTHSPDFPTQNPFQSTIQGSVDAFVTKLSKNGNSLVYSTYLGGSEWDQGDGIAVDCSGCAYVTGPTYSPDYPTHDPFQAVLHGIGSVFVTKLSCSGNSLAYSTYLGGTNSECGRDIAVDAHGCAYVTGETGSTDYPTQNPFQATLLGARNAFVTKLSCGGNSLEYSTYLGGTAIDCGHGIAVDISGCAYVAGETYSSNFPTQNPIQVTFQGGDFDAFVTKLSGGGNSLAYSTLLGGTLDDTGNGIAIDTAGCAHVFGRTSSNDFPTQNPYQASNRGPHDAFIVKISDGGNSLVYGTYLGGVGGEEGNDVAVDASGCAYVTGVTFSQNFPTESPYQTSNQGGSDAYVTKLRYLCCVVRGDFNHDGMVDVSDIVDWVDWAFAIPQGPAPGCDEAGYYPEVDHNNDGVIDVSDIVYWVDWSYSIPQGPAPVVCE